MMGLRDIRWLGRLLLLAFGCLHGCIAFYGHRTLEVHVLDAETSAPISEAKVEVKYLSMFILNAPRPDMAVTNKNGTAKVKYATFDFQMWNASAIGYLGEHFGPPASGNGGDSQNVRLYKLPKPEITIIVPNGYHGPLKIDMIPVPQWIQDEVGKRQFTYRASPTGYVRINATPLLLSRWSLDVHGRYEDGRSIPRDLYRFSKSPDARLFWLEGNGHRDLFVVGTDQDVQAVQSIVYDTVNGDPNSLSPNSKAFDALFFEALSLPQTRPSP